MSAGDSAVVVPISTPPMRPVSKTNNGCRCSPMARRSSANREVCKYDMNVKIMNMIQFIKKWAI